MALRINKAVELKRGVILQRKYFNWDGHLRIKTAKNAKAGEKVY